jgi:outer membrane immunogenic protein
MRNSKFIVSAIVAASTILGIGAASAADLAARPYTKAPPPVMAPVYTWTGCYIGGNAGGGWAHKENIDSFIVPNQSLGTHDATGAVAGGQIGCDYQTGQFVFGVRGMFDWADVTGQNTIPQNPLVAYNTRISWFDRLTARVGFLATPNLLLYIQGGGTWLQDRHQQLFPQPAVINSERQNRGGATVGGGLEYMFAPNWSVFGEYNYTFFDDSRTCFVVGSCPGIGVGNPGGIIQKLNFQTAVIGVNYHFNWAGPVVAKY